MSEKNITKETIEERVAVLTEKFDNINEQIVEKREVIDKIRNEVAALQDEQKRLQGEYRLIISLGAEFNLINEEDDKKE